MSAHDNWKDNFGQALSEAIAEVGGDQIDWSDVRNVDELRDELLRTMPPIDMILHCPKCHAQHIDASEPVPVQTAAGLVARGDPSWNNPPHRSHLCRQCGNIWRPADVATNGVAAIKTQGKLDSQT